MSDDTQIWYTAVLTGDQQAHEALREILHEHDVEIVREIEKPADRPTVATLECTECGDEFTTAVDADGSLQYNGVSEHSRREHPNERWDYNVLDHPGDADE